MNIGTRYNLTLLATISGKLRLVAAQLVAITDSSVGTVSSAITEHSSMVYRLPDALKTLDIYSQTFYHFREAGTTALIVVPEAYINQPSIQAITQITRTVVFSFTTNDEFARLVQTLDDGNFSYNIP